MAKKSSSTAMQTDAFSEMCVRFGLGRPIKEHRFHETRKWRFDWAFLEFKLAIECEGGVWSGGRHTRGVGFSGDCIKYAEAAVAGWTVMRFTTKMINDGTALLYAKSFIEKRRAERKTHAKEDKV